MRRQISTLIPRKANICIFCALRNPGEVTRSARRAYHPSRINNAASNAASPARQYDDDDGEDGFAMLKNSAAKDAPPLKTASVQPLRVNLPQTRRQTGRPPDSREPRDSRDSQDPRAYVNNTRTPASFDSRRNGNDGYNSPRYRDRGQQPEFRMRRTASSPVNLRTVDSGHESGQTGPGSFRIRFDNRNVQQEREPPREPGNRIQPAPGYRKAPLHKEKPEETLVAYTPSNLAQGSQEDTDGGEVVRLSPSIDQKRVELKIEDHSRTSTIEPPSTAPEPRFRLSSRFGSDEDEAEVQPQPQRKFTTRGRTADFDFELYEAEQALSGKRGRKKKKDKALKVQPTKPTVYIPEFITVQQLAQSLKIKQDDLLKKLEEEGFEGARHDHMLDAETAAMFADIYGFEPIALEEEMQDLVSRPPPEDMSMLPARPPIVTIMGHVDHGKTTILDWLRKSSVVAGEHGGITQHIGAFSVIMPGTEKRITFLDTPGHEAFLDMRRRGANVTDIVVLVVAADDSVKPQTVEAIKHALEAGVQIIVAINKVDKHDANIEQVKQDLTRHEIVVEDYGGDYQAIPVSGKTGQGMEQLEEAIITLADVLDLRAEQDIPAEGQIIESKVTNAGRVATVLVRRGVLRVGDFIVAGPTWGRVRTLRNDAGQQVEAAYPGDPVQVDGWRGDDPTAGLEVLQADTEQQAKDVVDMRIQKLRSVQSLTEVTGLNATKAQEAEDRAKVLAWEKENLVNSRRRRDNEGWVDTDQKPGAKEVFFVIKADVAGSVEAIVAAVSAIGNNEIRASVIHSGTGPITESDIRLLATSGEGSYAISFNQPIEPAMHNLAQAARVQILNHNIIYKVTDAVKEKVAAALPPILTQRVLGEAEIGKIFEITVKKQKIKIAGCKVTNGTISRSNKVRVIRNGETVYSGNIDSLKNVKKDVTEMRKGTECGIGFSEWEEVQTGDQVQCFEEKEEQRTLY